MATTALTPENADQKPAETLVEFPDNLLLIELCGEFDRNLAQIEQGLDVQILRRGNELALYGEEASRLRAAETLRALYTRLETGSTVEPGDVDGAIRLGAVEDAPNGNGESQLEMFKGGKTEIKTRKKSVAPRTAMQAEYVGKLFKNDVVFGLGPAGTGKTYLAVAVAVSMFVEGHVDRILLSRPAVEAGERLGFLPGDMKDKVDPYMQPLYDALAEMKDAHNIKNLIDNGSIEIAPLAFMRGRTLKNAIVVLDEAQNTTHEQMKMFLTRMGENSRLIITGDISQIDLPAETESGLKIAIETMTDVDGLAIHEFTTTDVVRHEMVGRMINAYEKNGL